MVKKGVSPTGTIHLFNEVDVRRAPQTGDASAICGQYTHEGTFTTAKDLDALGDALCQRCKSQAKDIFGAEFASEA